MKNKKKITSWVLGVTVLGTSFIFGSTSVIDPVLDCANQITRKIFEANAIEDKVAHGYIYSSYLKGADGENDYILTQCATGGYAIFEKDSMEIIEYSDKENSPYKNIIVEDNYYAGPFAYFTKKGEGLENIKTGEFIEKEKTIKIAKQLKNKISEDRNIRTEKFDKIKNSKDIIDNSFSLELKSPGPTETRIIDADNYTVKSKKYISNYQYFLGNHGHGENFDGTCVSVAVQLLLGYNNWAKDGRLIPRITNNPQEKFWDSNWTESSRLQPYSDIMRSTNSSDEKYDNEISFYEKLKEYINPYARSADEKDKEKHSLNNGATLSQASAGIINYLEDYAFERINDIRVTCNEPLILTDDERSKINNKLIEEIDNNRPAIGTIYVYSSEEDSDFTTTLHAVVIYGCQTITWYNQEIDGLIAHFGWQEEDTHIWFNSSWMKGYLTFETNHIHDDGIQLDAKNHVYECGECGGVFIKGYHDSSSIATLDLNDQQYHSYHLATCNCGYYYKMRHDFSYRQISEYFHVKSCEYCDYEQVEKHFFKFAKCYYCGYISINGENLDKSLD